MNKYDLAFWPVIILLLFLMGSIYLILVDHSFYGQFLHEDSEEHLQGYNEGYNLHNETKYTKCIEYITISNDPEYFDAYGTVGKKELVNYCKGYIFGYETHEKEAKIIRIEQSINATL